MLLFFLERDIQCDPRRLEFCKLNIRKLSLMIRDAVMMPRYMTDNRSYSSIVGSCETISQSGVI